MIGRTDNNVADSTGVQQAGRDIHGIDPALFIEEMRRKDARIDALIAEKDALVSQVNQLERAELERELTELRAKKSDLNERLANPEQALQEHTNRVTQIEQLLDDTATQHALGENRIRSALAAFRELEYGEIDALLAETEERALITAAKAAYGRGMVAEDAIRWQDAYTHYKRAAEMQSDLNYLRAYARISWRLAKFMEALQAQELVVAHVKVREGDKCVAYATEINNFAGIVRAHGRPNDAERLYREALEIDRVTIGEGHPEHATRLNNLAGVLREQGRLEEAERLYREAIEIDRVAIGEEHPSYAIRLSNLARLVNEMGRSGEAEELYLRALEIDRITIGDAHINYAIHLNNLAFVVLGLDRFEEAEQYYIRALKIFKSALPPDHSHIQQIEGNLTACRAVRP
ncbi:tetratricopeptide repeat protein [uncultured Roseobacter sp.]|uniref:tetratricopeptide repeat protein n=1 Tax=uncultured Roseobacter sp. TaxID=114847 RepID=UPI00261CB3E5|nr:tetratricopeptide repeat protein [uncultured Roseobacter sp.]